MKDGTIGGDLRDAAYEGLAEEVRRLLDAGVVDVDAVYGQGLYTPLHCASMEGHGECVRLLLDNGLPPTLNVGGTSTLLKHAHAAHNASYATFIDTNTPARADFGRLLMSSQTPLQVLFMYFSTFEDQQGCCGSCRVTKVKDKRRCSWRRNTGVRGRSRFFSRRGRGRTRGKAVNPKP